MIRLAFGYAGSITVDPSAEYPLPFCPYPMVFYTQDGDSLCETCAIAQLKEQGDRDYAGDPIIGLDALEGSALDHGIVVCDECGKEIVSLDPDEEWPCARCGAINRKSEPCACGQTQDSQTQDGQREKSNQEG